MSDFNLELPPPGPNAVRRDGAKTALNLVGALVLLGVAVATVLLVDYLLVGIIFGVLLGGVGAYFLYRAYNLAGIADCPSCGLVLQSLPARESPGVFCPECRTYHRVHQGQIEPMPEDHVATAPHYAARCPSPLRWPEGCCVCWAPVSRALPVKLELDEDAPFFQDMAARIGTLGIFKLVNPRTFALEVPHCAAHEDGAELELGESSEEPAISFRSYAYFRQFCELNQTEPLPPFFRRFGNVA